jgi:hypothetical protein
VILQVYISSEHEKGHYGSVSPGVTTEAAKKLERVADGPGLYLVVCVQAP